MDLNRRELLGVPAATMRFLICRPTHGTLATENPRRANQYEEHDPAVLDVEQWADYLGSLK